MDMRYNATLVSTLGALLLCVACDRDKDGTSSPADDLTDSELALQWRAKLEECKVTLSPGNAGKSNYETVEDAFSRCAARCDLAATCDHLLEAWCEGGLPAGHPLLKCVQKCPLNPKDGFTCDDGETIPFAAVCDGFATCAGEEDEEGCEAYVCEDGQEVVGKDIECDNRGQCEDYSDEDRCPLPVSCLSVER